uniref:Uncharacterized protein n=1 Tax=Arundo donax TaxID=35708 RepID=A0A0A9B0Y0_ARUDO
MTNCCCMRLNFLLPYICTAYKTCGSCFCLGRFSSANWQTTLWVLSVT